MKNPKGQSEPHTTDWRLYEMLTKAEWRPGDEPIITSSVEVTFDGRRYVVPLPSGSKVKVT